MVKISTIIKWSVVQMVIWIPDYFCLLFKWWITVNYFLARVVIGTGIWIMDDLNTGLVKVRYSVVSIIQMFVNHIPTILMKVKKLTKWPRSAHRKDLSSGVWNIRFASSPESKVTLDLYCDVSFVTSFVTFQAAMSISQIIRLTP